MTENCLFCGIVSGAVPSKLVYEDDQVYAFHDINPGAPTHVLIIPREHIATLNDLEERHEPLVGRIFSVAKKIAADLGLDEVGYRTVFNTNAGGGQTVYHIHLHLLAGRSLKWPPG